MPTTSNSATITVSDSGSLRDAYNTLSRSGGGTIEVAQGARPIEIALSGGGTGHVNIVSANDRAPTLLHRISFDKVENVTVSDFRIDSSDVDRPDWHMDLMVNGGGNIAIENSTFTSNALGRYSPNDADTVLGESLAKVRNTKDFSFEGNSVSDYYQGLAIFETIGVSVADNEFSGLQGDGLRLAGVQQTEISGNDMHNFVGTMYNFNHNDFIQVWSTNVKLLTKDLTISGNTLISGDGSSAQAIFVGNELYSRGDKDHRYQNITISDNLVSSGNANGIAVFGANNVNIDRNTVLWDVDTTTVNQFGSSGTNAAPTIRFSGITNGSITNNIAPGITGTEGKTVTGNKILDYTHPNDSDYVGVNFINAFGGSNDDHDYHLRPDSAWNGVAGSSLTRATTRSEGGVDAIFTADGNRSNFYAFTLDASPSVDEGGHLGDEYDFVWMFGDGTVLQGETVNKTFASAGMQNVNLNIYRDGQLVDQSERSIEVQSKTLLDLNLTGSVDDLSSYDSKVLLQGAKELSKGYQIGGEDRIEINRSSQQIHDLESFNMTMDLQVLNKDSGRFLLLHKVMDATVNSNGTLRFTLITDEGTFRVDSGNVVVNDGRFHELGFDYNGNRLRLLIDGDVIGETDAEGTTAPQSYHHLVLGSTWSAGVDAVVNSLTLDAESTFSASDAKSGPTDPDLMNPEPSEPKSTPMDPKLEPDVIPVPEKPNIPKAEETPNLNGDLPPEVAPTWPTMDGGKVVADVNFEMAATDGLLGRFDSRALAQSGTGYEIGPDYTLQIDRRVDELHGLEAFSLEMDVTADADDLSGALLHFYKVFEVTTSRDGSLRFKLETDEGTFYARTDDNPLADGKEHRLGVSYDDDLGKMSLRVDDVVVAESEASGITADRTYHGLTLGHSWAEKGANSFSMLVDELVLRTRVSDGMEEEEMLALAPVIELPSASPADSLGQPSDLVLGSTQNDAEIFL